MNEDRSAVALHVPHLLRLFVFSLKNINEVANGNQLKILLPSSAVTQYGMSFPKESRLCEKSNFAKHIPEISTRPPPQSGPSDWSKTPDGIVDRLVEWKISGMLTVKK